MRDRRPARAREWLLVAAVFVVIAAAAATWLALDRRPPEWDHANHLERAVLCARDLERGALQPVLERSSFYPPLVLCAAGVVYLAAPSDVAAAQSVVLAFLGLGMGAVYLLGRRVGGGAAGVAAAVVFGTAPFVVFSALRFQLDLPLATMVAATLVALLASEGFHRRPASLAVGLLCGLGLLTKPTFVVYVLPPALLVAARARSRRAWANLGLTVVVTMVLALPWYGPRLFGMLGQFATRSFGQAAESGYPEALTAGSLLFYPQWFIPQFGLVATICFLVGLGVTVWRRRGFLLVALLPLAALLFVQNKNLRYMLPLLPVASAIAGLGFAALSQRVRFVSGVALTLAGIVQVGGTTVGLTRHAIVPPLGVPFLLESPPMRGDWRHREILALIERDRGQASATVSVVPNYNFFSVSNFRYYGLRDGYSLQFTRAWDTEPIGVDYMILKTGDVGPEWTADKPRRIAARFAKDPYLERAFPVLAELPLPDGSVATVRARRIHEAADAAPAALAARVERDVRRHLDDFATEVEGLQIRVVHDEAIRSGRIERLEIDAAVATLGELRRRGTARLRVHDLRLVVEDVLVNPWSLAAVGRVDALDAGGLRVERATIRADDFRAFLAGVRAFRRAEARLEAGTLEFRFAQPGPDVFARVRLMPAGDRPFAVRAEKVRVGGVPIPGPVVDWVIRNYDPAPRMASRLRVDVAIGRVQVEPEAIRIGPQP